MKRYLIPILILILFACSSQEVKIASLRNGTYASIDQSGFKSTVNRFFNNAEFVIGDTLIIKDKINFSFSTCGNYGYGKYDIAGDSLYLNFDSSASYMDNIMLKNEFTYTYFIKNDSMLIREFEVKLSRDSEESQKVISELHYLGREN